MYLSFCDCPKVCGGIHCIIMWWLTLSKCVVMSWHVSHWDYFMTSWKKSHWRDWYTWNVGPNMNTYPGEFSHLYHWCLLHWVSRGHPVSIPGGDCFPWVCIEFDIKFVFKTTFFHSKSWLWTWNTLQCVSSSCPFAQVGITPQQIIVSITRM